MASGCLTSVEAAKGASVARYARILLDSLAAQLGRQAVGVATIVDGSRVMEFEGNPVVPFLTFGVVDPNSEEEEVTGLLSSGEPSSMHEYPTGVVSELFES